MFLGEGCKLFESAFEMEGVYSGSRRLTPFISDLCHSRTIYYFRFGTDPKGIVFLDVSFILWQDCVEWGKFLPEAFGMLEKGSFFSFFLFFVCVYAINSQILILGIELKISPVYRISRMGKP